MQLFSFPFSFPGYFRSDIIIIIIIIIIINDNII